MNDKEIVKIYKALSVDSRLQILKLIKDKKLCVNAISQHLSVLKQAGLVKSERYGSIIHYTININQLEKFKKSVRKILGDEFVIIT